MKKAIYYVTNQFRPDYIFNYENKETFDEGIRGLNKYVQVIKIFGPSDDPTYQLFTEMDYDELLLNNVAGLYLVNRRGESVLFKNIMIESSDYGVLNLDAILVEKKQELINAYRAKNSLSITVVLFFGMFVYLFSK